MTDEISFTEEEMQELKKAFFDEAFEILQTLRKEMENLEAEGEHEDALKNVQRYYHTIKGNARAMGFTNLSTLGLHAEALLKKIQETSRNVDPGLRELLHTINDSLQQYLDGHHSGSEVQLDEGLVGRIEAYLEASGGSAKKP